ncbi:MAG: metal-dependent hydrolase [Chitinophagales bacterium]|nr:metal-dependent hydrolase [Chitinophagaceae bacterium]MCB9063557.1 metal-dependent hydrolase [Chitinophagales bacterium]
MKLTYYGHACFGVEIAGKKLLFDPFISGNDSAKDIEIGSIEADYILLSHGHGDHIADVFSIADSTDALVIGILEVTGWVEKQGYKNCIGMNLGEMSTDFGTVRMVPASHTSSMPDGSYGGNPAGFVIKTDEGNFYYSGDTCLTMDMQLIPRYGKMDFAVMPIGGHFTMNPSDAVIAAEFAQCDRVVGVHYNTWPPIAIDTAEAQKIFKDAGRELLLPAIGETIDL